jgi:beta-glucanase (GH16 family)
MVRMSRRLLLGGALALPMILVADESVGARSNGRPGRGGTTTTTTTTTTTVPPTSGPAPTGVPGSWALVLDDEFNGTELNTSLWNTQYPWGEDNNGDGSENCYLPGNVSLDGEGHLVLTAQRGLVEGTSSTGQPKSWPYSSGQVNTFGNFSFTHGVLEARAKVPAGLGTWPAFWALPANGSWPPEVDVMEVYGTDPGTVDMTYHWGSSSNPQSQDLETTLPDGEVFSSAFHVFTCAVTPQAITWYLDGVKQWSYTGTKEIAQLVPLYIVCNLAIGGSGGDPTDTDFPLSYLVDYIRVWEAAG